MSRKQRVEMLIIDPQNDFCDPKGNLYVTGADVDSLRLCNFIKKNIMSLNDIHVTLDTHRELDVAHPMFWINKKGQNPPPFTLISNDDVVKGNWTPFNPNLKMPPYGTLQDRMIYYTKKLEENGKYLLCIWPPHCKIGTWGHNVVTPIMSALDEWEKKRYGVVDYVTKGSNIFTEHYSGVQADVPDPEDSTTQLNMGLIQVLENADVILLSGQALSHCVANTARDIFKNFGSDSLKKITVIIDTTSSVPGFEKMGEDFVEEAKSLGVNFAKSTDIIL